MADDLLAAYVRRPARAAGFGGLTASMLAAYELHRLFVPQAQRAALLDRYRRAWLDVVLGIFGVEIDVQPAWPKPATRARLVVSNHRSALDIAVLLRLFGGHMLSRADLAAWPLVGTIARVGGTIFVERTEGLSRAAAARAIRRKLAEGATVSVFPEGTTYEGDEVRPFFPGAIAAAKGLDVEVVPVGLAYPPGAEFHEESFVAHLASTAGRAHTRVVVCVGESRVLTGDTKRETKALHGEVQQLVTAARRGF
jgi:1-acyl-sn-glycerol-3-phosphate acyltransferase